MVLELGLKGAAPVCLVCTSQSLSYMPSKKVLSPAPALPLLVYTSLSPSLVTASKVFLIQFLSPHTPNTMQLSVSVFSEVDVFIISPDFCLLSTLILKHYEIREYCQHFTYLNPQHKKGHDTLMLCKLLKIVLAGFMST